MFCGNLGCNAEVAVPTMFPRTKWQRPTRHRKRSMRDCPLAAQPTARAAERDPTVTPFNELLGIKESSLLTRSRCSTAPADESRTASPGDADPPAAARNAPHPPAPPRRARQLATVGRKTVPSPHANHSIWSNRAQDLRAPVPRHREIPTGTARAILPPARDPTTNRRVVILPSSPRPLASHRRRRTTKVRGKKSERSPRCCRCERGAAGIQLLGSRARVEPEPLLSGGADTSFRDWSVRPTNCRLRIAPQGAVRD
jgi:hypothetical protein